MTNLKTPRYPRLFTPPLFTTVLFSYGLLKINNRIHFKNVFLRIYVFFLVFFFSREAHESEILRTGYIHATANANANVSFIFSCLSKSFLHVFVAQSCVIFSFYCRWSPCLTHYDTASLTRSITRSIK